MAEGASTHATKQPSFYNSCFSYRPASAWHNAPSRDAVVHDAFQVAFDASGIAEHVAAFLRWAMLTPSPFLAYVHAHHAKKMQRCFECMGPCRCSLQRFRPRRDILCSPCSCPRFSAVLSSKDPPLDFLVNSGAFRRSRSGVSGACCALPSFLPGPMTFFRHMPQIGQPHRRVNPRSNLNGRVVVGMSKRKRPAIERRACGSP